MNRDDLMKCVRYDSDTGHFTWLRSASNRTKTGSRAGTKHGNGYRRVEVLGERVFEHRLAWFYMTGQWPVADIDHINGIRDDNRWSNLREVSRSENNLNLRGRAKTGNRTGHLGVSVTKSGTYLARIKIGGSVRYLGTFRTPETAAAAYQDALAQR